jgi:hypothetical protein
MPKVFPCYSTADRDLARDLAAFLEQGTGAEVLLEEGEMQPGTDLIAKVQEGLAADAVFVLLSPDSVPARWILDRWQPVFWGQAAQLGTALATVLCRDCQFPDLLRRRKFFDARQHRLSVFRAAKRWLLRLWPVAQQAPFAPAGQPAFTGRDAELDALCTLLADRPGLAVVAHPAPGSGKTALALAFARRHQLDFDAVFWLTCGDRTAASLAGDLATQLGVRLDRDLESVLHELRHLCARHRCLLVLDDAHPSTAASFLPRGRTSVLITTRHPALAESLSLARLPFEPRPTASPASTSDPGRRLLSAACACAPSGFRLEIAARAADLDLPETNRVAASLAAQGFLTELDENGPRFLATAAARDTASPDGCRLAHAQAVAALFDQSSPGDLTQFWPDLQLAFQWAIQTDWILAGTLARRALAWARAHDRLSEAFEILNTWFAAAQSRDDRRVLEDCAWEQIWILEHWGRAAEARQLDSIRRTHYTDQLAFDFLS